jgi:HD-like signal output (HDOD) protein
MNFNGDLSKYHPADAIMFLSQLDLNGLLSISENHTLISVSFKNGSIIDAQSKRGDAKILHALIHQRHLSPEQARRIDQVKMETGMPVRHILAQLNYFPLATAKDCLLIGMKEVLLEMFLLESGSFHFTDTPVDTDSADTCLDARMLSIRIAAQSDEFRDFEKSILSLDRQLSVSAEAAVNDLPADMQTVLRLAPGCLTLGQLLEKTPFDSHTVMEIIKKQLETGAIVLHPPLKETDANNISTGVDPMFSAFRQALKTIVLCNDSLKHLEAFVTYCRSFYDGMLIVTAKNNHIIHCKQIVRHQRQGFLQKTRKGRIGAIDDDAVLSAVHRSGVGFFGEQFPSQLFERLTDSPGGGECALLPVVIKGPVSIFLYVFSREKVSGLSPQHYLELLSWMTTSRKKLPGDVGTDSSIQTSRPIKAEASGSGELDAVRMVSTINDLPPLPTLVTRALELLADPEVDIKEIEAVIGKDQSIVAKLIRVSNSALYGSLVRVESLQQALARLGAKTTKSLVLAASMQNYFLNSNPGVQAWGQALWQHAAESGLAARRIAVAVGYDDPEKAFVGGVVHDIGKLVILLTGNGAYREIENLKRRNAMPALEAEKKVLGTDHAAIGVLLMEKWKMPQSAKACVQYHHCVNLAGKNGQLAAIAAYANHLSHLFGAQPLPMTPDDEANANAVVSTLGLSDAERNSLVESVTLDFQDSSFF